MSMRHTDAAAFKQDVLAAVRNVLREEQRTFATDFAKSVADSVTAVVHPLQDRIEELESRASQPGRTGGSSKASEHMRLFEAWLRKPRDHQTNEQLSNYQARELKAINIGTPADGGYAVPTEIAREIERLELKLSPVRRLVKVMQVGSPDFKHLVSIRGAGAGWVGETDVRTETSTPQLRERAPTMGELYAYPQHTEWAGDDIFFSVADWLSEEVADRFAQLEADAMLRGNGSNKPTGMLATTPTADPDFASPLRAAGAYQYIPSVSPQSPAVAEITPDALISLVYAVNSRYRANGTWAMNSRTAGVIRKLKDDNGQYLWAPGLVAGQPDRLLGYPVEVWEQMDDIGPNNFPVAFGDFRRGYLLVDRVGLRITVDNNISQPGRVKYFVRRRVGGTVLNNDAVKWLRTTVA